MTLQQAANTEPVPHAHVPHLNYHPEECEPILSQFFHEQLETEVHRWYTTPETCNNPTKMNKIKRRIHNEIITLRVKEQLNVTKTDEKRIELLWKINWDESSSIEDKKSKEEHLSAKYQFSFAKHRLDKGISTEFKLQLTPQHEKPVYSQNLTTPTKFEVQIVGWTCNDARVRYYNHPSFLQVLVTNFFSMQTGRSAEDFGWLTSNQTLDKTLLGRTKPPNGNLFRSSTTHGREEELL